MHFRNVALSIWVRVKCIEIIYIFIRIHFKNIKNFNLNLSLSLSYIHLTSLGEVVGGGKQLMAGCR